MLSLHEISTRSFVKNYKVMTKQILFLFFTSFLFSGCYSVKKSVEKAQPYSSEINWPNDYKPANSDFYIHNKMQINADPKVIWELLIKAEDWPNWYEGMRDVEILNTEDNEIKANSKLKFSTMDQLFEGTIREFEPYSRLAWETRNEKLMAYHAWLIIPNEKGCLLITDEVQKGKLAKLQKIFLPNKLRKLHDIWLTEFKTKSENQ
jgi:uncharacterized protein YndB with AHSA1/START domain